MIVSFKDKITEDIYNGITNKKNLKYKVILAIIHRKLDMINAANDIKDLMIPPSNKLKKLSGKLKEFYSIRINKQYRIIFKWHNNNAFEVSITDYH